MVIALAFVLPPLGLAVNGLRRLEARQQTGVLPRLPAGSVLPPTPAHDPGKRTVAVLLGADLTEITDALGPYEMFARAGVFNVYAVAPERQPTMLSGGLRILPHLSLSDLDRLLAGRPPAIVVVPMIPNSASRENRPLVEWMQRQAAAGALMHSWCTGAMALAEAGLLDGLTATAHWGDLGQLAKRYPRVRWVRGVRWVDHGNVITSAGLTSGVDASLRVLAKTAGDDVARRVARELRYPNYQFSSNPTVAPYTIRPADTVLLANLAFRISREQIGLALYDGAGELDLSNLYDTHSYSADADVHAVGARPGYVRTAHGLTVLPSLVATSAVPTEAERIRSLDRVVVPGVDGRDAAATLTAGLKSVAPALPIAYLHQDAQDRFGLEPVIEDLARTGDRMTAALALRRLEYRSAVIRIEGATFPWAALPLPLGTGLLGVLVAVALQRIFRRDRRALIRNARPDVTGQARPSVTSPAAPCHAGCGTPPPSRSPSPACQRPRQAPHSASPS
jgi:putative intracellular protease/amidase